MSSTCKSEQNFSFDSFFKNNKTRSNLAAATAEFGGRQDVRKRSKTMEQHGHELNDQNEAEEEDEHQTDRFQMQLVLHNMRLFNKN
jgi:hypothetical protein